MDIINKNTYLRMIKQRDIIVSFDKLINKDFDCSDYYNLSSEKTYTYLKQLEQYEIPYIKATINFYKTHPDLLQYEKDFTLYDKDHKDYPSLKNYDKKLKLCTKIYDHLKNNIMVDFTL
jgi:tetratricopeptide (TPR) repeat protein